MKQQLLFKTIILAAMLCVGTSAWANCSVTTDSYGMTKIYWDFAIESKTYNATWYLDASSNSYVDGSGYTTSFPWSTIAQADIPNTSTRGIFATGSADSDGRTGAVLDKNSGSVSFWAPFTGKLTITGKYLNNVTVYDKGTNGSQNNVSFSTSASGGNTVLTVASVEIGHRVQIIGTGGGGCAITTLTFEPVGGTYGTDNVSAGDMDFTSTYMPGTVITGSTSADTHYQVTSTGYKAVSGKQAVKDALIVTLKGNDPATTATFGVTDETYKGMKIAGLSGNEYNYTTSVAGYLTINFNYGGDRGTWYYKDEAALKESKTSTSAVVNMPANSRLQVVLGSNGVYIKNITFTEVSNTPATITAAGWATLYTPYPLDFSSLSTHLTAYTATCTSSIVTLTPVTNVPANTGVVLKGAAKDYDIPVINSSSTDKGHMVGSTTAATAYDAFDGYDLYMLVKNASNEAQFKKVSSGSIAAGKAFLKINNSGASALSPVMNVVFADDNTTGINTVQGSRFMVNGYYDLQGRKVANPTKGLYIVNGKKVIIK